MNEISKFPTIPDLRPAETRARVWPWLAALVLISAGAGAYWTRERAAAPGTVAPPPPPTVAVSRPLARDVDAEIGFLGQFSAVDRVELRAQVGGTLTEIHFHDGQLVRKGDLLFVIDPRPYEIKLAQAQALLKSAQVRSDLAALQLARSRSLKRDDFATAETVDQRQSEQNAAQAAIEDAEAQVRDAQFDLDHCRVTAPFSGRIGEHLPSVGALIAGSRYAASPTTLLATLVSLDPIHLDFDMSEADFLTFSRQRARMGGAEASAVAVALGDEQSFARHGSLEFVDNALDRSSGTIHARAIVPNPDLFLTPGEFARLRLAVAPPAPSLLVPDAVVGVDQSQHVVMTVSPAGMVVPKPVEVGDLRGGLRVVRAGLGADDRVIVDGLVRAQPGAKVATRDGSIAFEADGTKD